ncbi:MAG: hypothetical protein IMX02_07700 [Limnochordaceae bacterium]|uniref:Succinate dehydrogenase n=1 Tax=Carboxydichorda subterranea TaxID=3109565 RepID=A0ABZ1BZ28_9FIRM|nr:hypothetical protein [Limnochorda sp. L945t]MBE3598671.1 hypothetical protein [Limnochordaceae bacterium]WRP18056.1 hypothetical protein U7230_03345 [Limnochorda sp. L945t]
MRESRLWALHLLSGAVLIVLLSAHMGLMHYEGILASLGWAGENVRGFASVAQRAKSTIWTVWYVLLLVFALYHGLYGTRRILQEVWHSARAARVIDTVVLLFGLVVLVYGVYTAVAAARMGGAF